MVLITQLGALMTTFLAMDILDGRVSLADCMKALGLLVVFIGIGLDSLGHGNSTGSGFGLQGVFLLAMVAVSGVGYGLQARCNGGLAEDVGSGARATMISAAVNILCSLPIDCWIFWGKRVSPTFDVSLWYLWLVAGFQSAFYIGSMAYLPKVLGFTTCYVVTLSAKLLTSLVVDDFGLTGSIVPITFARTASVVCVVSGAIIFNSRQTSGSSSSEDDEDGASVVSLGEGRSFLISGTFVTVSEKSSSFVGESFTSRRASSMAGHSFGGQQQ